MWVSYWRTTHRHVPRAQRDSWRLPALVFVLTPLAFAAADGVFGVTMRFVGIVLLLPLLPAFSLLLIGAPAMIIMGLYAAAEEIWAARDGTGGGGARAGRGAKFHEVKEHAQVDSNHRPTD
jgi:hypothetical protein